MLAFLSKHFHAKYQRYPCISFRDTNEKKILKSNCKRAFWPIACEVKLY